MPSNDERRDRIKRTLTPRQLAAQLGLAVAEGGKIHCPWHEERTPSCQLYEDGLHCFGCGAQGDVIDLWMASQGDGYLEALEILDPGGGVQAQPAQTPPAEWEILPPPGEITGAQVEAWSPKRARLLTYEPELIHAYRTQDGSLVGYVLRLKRIGGSKIYLPLQWGTGPTADGRVYTGWVVRGFGRDRPLYGLRQLIEHPSAGVVVVEGEKAADALSAALADTVVVTWMGGAAAIGRTDWAALAGRRVLIWPDHDEAGLDARDKVAAKLVEVGAAEIKEVVLDHTLPLGWDAADAVESETDIVAWIKKRAASMPPHIRPEVTTNIGDRADDNTRTDNLGQDRWANASFRLLGEKEGHYYILEKRAGRLVRLSASQLSRYSELLRITDPVEWQALNPEFFRDGKLRCEPIAVEITSRCRRMPTFELVQMRSMGLWADEGRLIANLGDRLLVDGQVRHYGTVRSRYTYVQAQAWPEEFDQAKPLTREQAKEIYSCLAKFGWVNKLALDAFAGWCVTSAMSGLLKWRAHIEIVGDSGTGKSTLVESAVALLDNFIFRSDRTTVAALRRSLRSSAKPVLLDEFESRGNKLDQNSIDIIEYIRSCSSAAPQHLTGKDGTVESYIASSSFCLTGINPIPKGRADASRIYQCALSRGKMHPDWAELKAEVRRLMHADVCHQFVRFVIEHAQEVLANIDVFDDALTESGRTSRESDQIAPLLAGAYLLEFGGLVSPEFAQEKVDDPELERDDTDLEAGKRTMLAELSMFKLPVQKLHQHGGVDRFDLSVSELVRIADRPLSELDEPLTPKEANALLREYGIWVKQTNVRFATGTRSPLTALFQRNNSTMAGGWQARAKEAGFKKSKRPIVFTAKAQFYFLEGPAISLYDPDSALEETL